MYLFHNRKKCDWYFIINLWEWESLQLTFIECNASDFGNILNLTSSPMNRTVFNFDSILI